LHNALNLKVEAIRQNDKESLMSMARFRRLNKRLYQRYGVTLYKETQEEDVSKTFRR